MTPEEDGALETAGTGYRAGRPVTELAAASLVDAVQDHVYTHHRIGRDAITASMEVLGAPADDVDAATVRDHLLEEAGRSVAGGLTVERYAVPSTRPGQAPSATETFSIIYTPKGEQPTYEAPHDSAYRIEAAEPGRIDRARAYTRSAASALQNRVTTLL